MSHSRALGLPLQHRRIAWGAVLLHTLVLLATMARDISHYDSPELALVGMTGGLGHPIGQPLYTILAYLVSALTGDGALLALNALSAVLGGLCLIPLMFLVERHAGKMSSRWNGVVAGVLILLGSQLALWEPFTRIEVYPLSTFLSLWVVARTVDWLDDEAGGSVSGAWQVGLGLGLCGAVHAYTALLTAVAMMLPAGHAWLCEGLRKSHVLRIGTGGLLASSLYVYVPLAGLREDGMFVWSRPTDLASLWSYFSGADYDANRQTDLSTFFEQYLEWLGWAAELAVLPWFVLGLLAWCRRGALWTWSPVMLGAMSVGMLAYNTVFHVGILDYWGYIAPATWLAAAGCASLLVRMARVRGHLRFAGVLIAVSLMICVGAGEPAPWERTRSDDDSTRVLSEGLLRSAPPNAIVVATSSHWVGPLLYLQQVEGLRDDVVVIVYGFTSSSWYWDFVQANRPSLRLPELRGENGRIGRLRRLFASNPDRPILLQDSSLAISLGVRVCGLNYFFEAGEDCRANPDDATTMAEGLQRRLAEGAPGATEVLAAVAVNRGEGLWRLGRAEDAAAAFLAGVPVALRPRVGSGEANALREASPLRGPALQFPRPVATGSPARALRWLAYLYAEAGLSEIAAAYQNAADQSDGENASPR